VGVINPMVKKRRSHWVGEPYSSEPDDWFSSAKEIPGSWWGRWSDWLERHAGGKRKAPAKQGGAKYKPIEPAPGRYVKHRIH
jgi:polyhydroxyalkanoate synthase